MRGGDRDDVMAMAFWDHVDCELAQRVRVIHGYRMSYIRGCGVRMRDAKCVRRGGGRNGGGTRRSERRRRRGSGGCGEGGSVGGGGSSRS